MNTTMIAMNIVIHLMGTLVSSMARFFSTPVTHQLWLDSSLHQSYLS